MMKQIITLNKDFMTRSREMSHMLPVINSTNLAAMMV